MGIFNNIKRGINNVASWAKNTWNLNEKFNPYFNKKEQFSTLQKINESIDGDITKIYQELKAYNPTKYSSAILRYERFLPKVIEHNKTIDKIDNGMKGFNFRSFIDAPLEHSISELNPYIIIVEKISSFIYKDEIYLKFCNEVLEIKNNFEFIKEQFLLLDLYKKAFDFIGDFYFDIPEKNKLITKLEPLLSCLKKASKRYYDFSKLDQIDQLIKAHNDEYVKTHKKDLLFNNIRGNSLDDEQREAILEKKWQI